MKKDSVILWLAVPQGLMLLVSSMYSLLSENFYRRETTYWAVQCVGQDMINLFVVLPLLIVTAALAAGKDRMVMPLWAGVNLYLVYTFLIYCFSVHFNSLFLLYCAILGFSFFSLVYYFKYPVRKAPDPLIFSKPVVRVIAFYFMAVALVFAVLWLAEIIPAIAWDSKPPGLVLTGTPSNPVHVIDLAILLPCLFLTGWQLLRKKPAAVPLIPALLMFVILMNLTIAGLTVILNLKGFPSGYIVAVVMSTLAVFSIFLTGWYYRYLVFQ